MHIPYCGMFTNKIWEFNLLQGLHSIVQPSFVCASIGVISFKPYLFTKFHTSKHLGKGVTQTCMFILFFVVVRKGYYLPTSYQNVGVIINPYLFTKFHTSKHLGKSYTNMHVHIVLCCGVKRVLFTNKLSECWCHIINPYLFTKFHPSKHLGKRVTQTCQPYGFPKSKVFTRTLICLFPAQSISFPSFICGCTPVSEIH